MEGHRRGRQVKIKFHGDTSNLVDIDVGDLLRFVDVTGHLRQGVLMEIEQCGFPRQEIVYLHMLEGEALNKTNTNLIFKCRKVS